MTGPTGDTGADGSGGLSEYGYIYNLAFQTVEIDAPVLFDSNAVLTPGIEHTPPSPFITLVEEGDYEVTFSTSGVEPNQFALFMNGAPVPGAIYGSGAGTQQNSGQVIFSAPAGAVLELRNHSSAAAVGLQTLAGGTQANTNASIVIKKLN